MKFSFVGPFSSSSPIGLKTKREKSQKKISFSIRRNAETRCRSSNDEFLVRTRCCCSIGSAWKNSFRRSLVSRSERSATNPRRKTKLSDFLFFLCFSFLPKPRFSGISSADDGSTLDFWRPKFRTVAHGREWSNNFWTQRQTRRYFSFVRFRVYFVWETLIRSIGDSSLLISDRKVSCRPERRKTNIEFSLEFIQRSSGWWSNCANLWFSQVSWDSITRLADPYSFSRENRTTFGKCFTGEKID